ncbi:MAG: hypothetical protein ACOZAK_00200 [Patescibacteria group bacterium]
MKFTTQKMLTCFQMKMNGATYEEIARATNYSVFSLRKYFSKQGRWRASYESWANETIEQTTQDLQLMLKNQTVKAFEVMVSILNNADKNPGLALKAAQDILNRSGITIDPATKDTATDAAEQIMLDMEAFKSRILAESSSNK